MSYLYPVRIWRGAGNENPFLEVYLYRGEFQLATEDALYSDGSRYRPMLIAFNALKKGLSKVKSVLVLGAGLGSALQILNKKGFNPTVTLVDNDMVVLKWTSNTLPKESMDKVQTVCNDANMFISNDDKTYDLLVVDIFKGRVVPDFVTEKEFLDKCKKHLNPGGALVLNYIVNSKEEWHKTEMEIRNVFPSANVLNHDINRIIIAKV